MPIAAAAPPSKTIEGIDAAWQRPKPAALAAAGKKFIVVYVSRDPSKNATKAECQAYLAAGIGICLVWETTQTRALSGAAAGTADGVEARRQARALGFPDSKPIYAAVDTDATASQLAHLVDPYLRAYAAAVGGHSRAGVYGGYDTVRYALDREIVAYGWQTYAWSEDARHVVQWDPRAQVQQYRNGVQLAACDVDFDRAMRADFGAWTASDVEDDMELTDKIKLVQKPDVSYSSATTTVEGILASTNYYVLQTRNLVQQVVGLVTDDKKLDEACAAALAKLPAGTTVDQATMQAAFVGALKELAAADVDPAVAGDHTK